MEIKITTDVAKWFKSELQIDDQGYIRFFPRYGFGGHIPGFSIGINRESPVELHESTELEGITFYVEDKDAWYFENVDLSVTLNEKRNEPDYICE